jgi:electron-transferring-flavoprotein dehydrogenase
VLEKGSEIGAHILSGAVIDPRSLDELIPDWRERECPLAAVPVRDNQHWFLTGKGKFSVPHWLTPGWMHNKGTYTGSLGNLCRWLASEAEELGVEIFPGFAAAEVLYDEHGAVCGVATGDMGVGRDGKLKPDYQPGMELHARYTLFAEGARGHLTKQVIAHFSLDADCAPRFMALD